ncbi:hypothetical protein A2331_00690 [Candidatus Falkowbacteria bacterium RIFOXYB2_FULL_34_18]|uniref:Rhodanese domain-containing protein n=1 Tax=Candidatus Falkowbacteria bacterium RIFOXYD2_FULL_34_120 TaxID=1798007 RepID=A0A1F5TLY3_9BACT|nr:MAG: hypothetical protein A2331_00690 [Candidatus Falkowbacteria bacterium RIFOXYB2_FULL_34_18]OGF29206.1 MAG: hypothetical protein A2500_06005 [Candidatus Falkowbacteria bacterium RIFOXYC12_FULL_34_55]OGF37744.1 MAG: hypothetical protein A2466_06335 [Candidatus Falkowbacteria bacterium RIFOXYC2_FULL_34_220]OGF38728.1 MAG: hypothetical protein A2515_01670 [Candidatus Falkowbacteria bacterium RIFOXYD12_FULL_34_57]OGF39962.1 MAG: hypothetical protein A2531_01925 [Candidatus Falkowbacteria bact
MIKEINFKDLSELYKNKEDLEIIDVREPMEYQEIHIKGAKLIPMNEVQSRLQEIDWNKKVIFYCRSGARSRMISKSIENQGQDIYNLKEGIMACERDWEGLEK